MMSCPRGANIAQKLHIFCASFVPLGTPQALEKAEFIISWKS
jgi:hypothetical protein